MKRGSCGTTHLDANTIRRLSPEAIVISPGPCTPAEAGCSLSIVREFHGRIPILGVCLGHQAIAAAFHARIVRAREPMHGRTSEVFHDGRDVFSGLPNPVTVCRYHSLVVEAAGLPDCLAVTARTADGTIMALRHRDAITVGLQFHPEAILTQYGYVFLQNFLRLAQLPCGVAPEPASELVPQLSAVRELPTRPVTF